MEIRLSKNTVENKISVGELVTKIINPDNETQKKLYSDKLYSVFKQNLWNKCVTVCRNNFASRSDLSQITEDIYSETIRIAFTDLKKVKLEKGIDDAKAIKILNAWLSVIVNHKILEHIRVFNKEKKNLDSYKEYLKLELDNGAIATRAVTKSYDEKKMKVVLDNLCPLSRDIVYASHAHGCFPHFDHITREFQKNTKHLPKPVKNSIIAKHQTTDENFRQVKQRAFTKIFSCISNPELEK